MTSKFHQFSLPCVDIGSKQASCDARDAWLICSTDKTRSWFAIVPEKLSFEGVVIALDGELVLIP